MTGPVSFEKLQTFVHRPPNPSGQPCDLCGAILRKEHEHLVTVSSGTLLCSCLACSLLFPVRKGARFRRVPHRVEVLPDTGASDELWAGLGVPVNLAFYFHSSTAKRVVAFFPSPTGPTPGSVDAAAWQRLAERWPALATMEPDVEALLLHGLGRAREAFLVPIDRCYELAGRLRVNWQGLSGGDAVRDEIRTFLDRLGPGAARRPKGAVHA